MMRNGYYGRYGQDSPIATSARFCDANEASAMVSQVKAVHTATSNALNRALDTGEIADAEANILVSEIVKLKAEVDAFATSWGEGAVAVAPCDAIAAATALQTKQKALADKVGALTGETLTPSAPVLGSWGVAALIACGVMLFLVLRK